MNEINVIPLSEKQRNMLKQLDDLREMVENGEILAFATVFQKKETFGYTVCNVHGILLSGFGMLLNDLGMKSINGRS